MARRQASPSGLRITGPFLLGWEMPVGIQASGGNTRVTSISFGLSNIQAL
jgi:hypothetical protein